MIIVIVPICLLIFLILCKKLPLVRGNVMWCLMIAGFVALLMGKVYNPVEWIKAWILGLDNPSSIFLSFTVPASSSLSPIMAENRAPSLLSLIHI